jgi:hypothetical protein
VVSETHDTTDRDAWVLLARTMRDVDVCPYPFDNGLHVPPVSQLPPCERCDGACTGHWVLVDLEVGGDG